MNHTDSTFFSKYTSLVNEESAYNSFLHQEEIFYAFLDKIDEAKSFFSYAEGKWSLKEILQHLIDTERIFSYRALSISRKETIILPGYDENIYATNSTANKRSWMSLVEEMKAVRKSTFLLYESFTNEMLMQEGKYSSASGTVETIGLIITGHVYHHIKIVEERYFL
jgi:hypothetical protein